MLLQAAFLVAAGFSHTALRRPCANAACQLPQPRAAVCAAADAENNDVRARLESLWALPSENEHESELRSAGGDVWASKDLRSFADGKLVVRKHTKGQLPPGSKADPMESLLAEQFLVKWEHLVDGERDSKRHPGFMKVTADMLLSQEPPLPGGFTRGDVWATADIELEDQDIVAVKKHTKGSLLGPSVNAPAERLSVAWEHRADGEAGNINMDPGSLTSREPPLPGGFIRGDVWATADITLQDQDIVAVKKHTKGSLLGPSETDPTRLLVEWKHRTDIGKAGKTTASFDQLTSQEPLPGGFTRGDVVWATSDLPSVKPLGGQGSKMVMVKKHTKGSILGLTEVDPTQLLVSWEDQDNSGKAESTLVSPDKLTIVTRATR